MGRAVRDYAQGCASIMTGKAKKIYECILERGEYFEGASPSSTLPRAWLAGFVFRARFKKCYYNAQLLALVGGFREVEYYEGVAYNGVITTLHAWNVYNGKVIDLTWERLPEEFPYVKNLEKFQYLGVKIPLELVIKMNPLRRGVAESLLPYLKDVGYIQSDDFMAIREWLRGNRLFAR